jgi:hypothetical protein
VKYRLFLLLKKAAGRYLRWYYQDCPWLIENVDIDLLRERSHELGRVQLQVNNLMRENDKLQDIIVDWRVHTSTLVRAYGESLLKKIRGMDPVTETEVVRSTNPTYPKISGPDGSGMYKCRAWVMDRLGDVEAMRMAATDSPDPEPERVFWYKGFPVVYRGDTNVTAQ